MKKEPISLKNIGIGLFFIFLFYLIFFNNSNENSTEMELNPEGFLKSSIADENNDLDSEEELFSYDDYPQIEGLH